MANPVGFDGANTVFRAPDDEENCVDLEALRLDSEIVSCWRLTDEELTNIQKTGVIWLSVLGKQMPMVLVSGGNYVEMGGKPAVAQPYIKPAKRSKT